MTSHELAELLLEHPEREIRVFDTVHKRWMTLTSMESDCERVHIYLYAALAEDMGPGQQGVYTPAPRGN